MSRVRKAWLRYRELCVPPDAGENQLVQTEQAFYAGAVVLLDTLMVSTSEGKGLTPEDQRVIIEVHAELRDFVRHWDTLLLERERERQTRALRSER